MTSPYISAALARMSEVDTISRARKPGMPDEQLDREYAAAKRLRQAIMELELACEEVNTVSRAAIAKATGEAP